MELKYACSIQKKFIPDKLVTLYAQAKCYKPFIIKAI